MSNIDLEAVREFVNKQPEGTKIYIGADSERINIKGTWYADYALAIVVHVGGCNGCKVFGKVERERDYDQKKSRPALRLMNEVYKIAELFNDLHAVLVDKDIEVHLDLNGKKEHGSSCVIQEAIGYVRGVCMVDPVVKPNAWAASYAADRLKELLAA